MVPNVTAVATIGNLAVTWDAVSLIQARRFFNYTVILRVVSSKRQAPISRTVASSCTNCKYDFNDVVPELSYTVEVGITGFNLTFSPPTGKAQCIRIVRECAHMNTVNACEAMFGASLDILRAGLQH